MVTAKRYAKLAWLALPIATGVVIGVETRFAGLFIGGALFGIGCLMVRVAERGGEYNMTVTVPELRHYHGATWHAHDGGNVPHDHGQPFSGLPAGDSMPVRAFGRDGYVREGLLDSIPGFGKALLIIVGVIVAAFLVKWAYTEYYITTHCTMVLGTRVCQ